MLGHPQRDRLVDTAVGVCQVDIKVVDGCGERHLFFDVFEEQLVERLLSHFPAEKLELADEVAAFAGRVDADHGGDAHIDAVAIDVDARTVERERTAAPSFDEAAIRTTSKPSSPA